MEQESEHSESEEEDEVDSEDQYVPSDDEVEHFEEPKNLYADMTPGEAKPSYEDLKSGISSLISGAQTIDIMKKP